MRWQRQGECRDNDKVEAMEIKRNYARFYALLKELPYVGDREGLKKSLVRQATDGRTESLKETTAAEYKALCRLMEMQLPKTGADAMHRLTLRREIRRKRSVALHQMQLWGVDTANWDVVNKFCQDKRICGKAFRELSGDELEALTLKVRAMIWKREKE